ncbi:MFS transporter [Weissella confusa]|uniref:MFS transporter n=1 Tax=Weissella confusa TaxID=1583 RepID=UPI0022DEBECF|nr:MFS transporter [Weissella confusa]
MRKISPRLIYFFGALGGLLFGYDTGVISGAILYVQRTLGLNALEEGIVVSSVLLGAMIGAMSIGPLSDRFGRKKMVMVAALIFFIGSLGSAFSPEFGVLVASRVVLGVAVGGASSLVPTYLAEVAPAKMRGSLTSLNQLMVMTGILMAYLVNLGFSGLAHTVSWRWMLGFAALPSAILFIGGVFLPESPRYLGRIKKFDEALQVLNMLRTPEEAKAELAEMENAKDVKLGGFKELFSKFVRPALIIGVGMAVSLIALSILTSLSVTGIMSYVTIVAMAFYLIFFCATWGPIMWTMIGEVFPLSVRGVGVGFSSLINWGANLLVSLMFPVLLEHFSMPIIFGAFAVMCVFGSLFVKHFVFETRGRSLEEIESMLHQRAKDSATGAVPHGAMIQH